MIKIGILGLGGGGSNATATAYRKIKQNVNPNVDWMIANTDIEAIQKIDDDLSKVSPGFSNGLKKVLLGEEILSGLGAGSEPFIGYVATLNSREKIEEFLEEKEFVFISVGLGGGTGSGAVVATTELARQMGVIPIVFATLPWAFEGNNKFIIANAVVNSLNKQKGAGGISIINNSIERSYSDTVFNVFDKVDNFFVKTILSLVTIMYEEDSLINIDINDIKTALKNNEQTLFFFEKISNLNSENEEETRQRFIQECDAIIQNGNVNVKEGGNLTINVSGSKKYLQMSHVTSLMSFLSTYQKEANSRSLFVDVFFGTTFSQSYFDNALISGFITHVEFTGLLNNPLYTNKTFEDLYKVKINAFRKELGI